MEPITSARAWRRQTLGRKVKQQKTRLTYSNASGIIQEGPAPEVLVVCIIQVAAGAYKSAHHDVAVRLHEDGGDVGKSGREARVGGDRGGYDAVGSKGGVQRAGGGEA